jgi:ABC-type branched-subunit amino acid transport system ATPase component
MSGTALLEAKALTVRFGGLVALNGLDLVVRRAEVLGLIGPNGSGKTTFFNVISGIHSAASGAIILDGRDITREPAHNLAALGLSRTFQRSRLCLPLSIFDNIALGARRRLHNGVLSNLLRRGALRREIAGLTEEVRRLAGSFNPSLAERLHEPTLALGMIDRRRVEICRALIGRPKLLLLDEPSAGMTHEEANQLMDEILAVRRDRGDPAIIIVEHEMGMIERVTDRCVVLNFGAKICEGRFRDVAAEPIVREAYLGKA